MPRDRDPSDAPPDLVKYLLGLVRPLAQDVPPGRWLELEAQAKRLYGGERYYIPRLGHQGRARRARSSPDMPT